MVIKSSQILRGLGLTALARHIYNRTFRQSRWVRQIDQVFKPTHFGQRTYFNNEQPHSILLQQNARLFLAGRLGIEKKTGMNRSGKVPKLSWYRDVYSAPPTYRNLTSSPDKIQGLDMDNSGGVATSTSIQAGEQPPKFRVYGNESGGIEMISTFDRKGREIYQAYKGYSRHLYDGDAGIFSRRTMESPDRVWMLRTQGSLRNLLIDAGRNDVETFEQDTGTNSSFLTSGIKRFQDIESIVNRAR